MPTDPDRIAFCVKCDTVIQYAAARCKACGAKQPKRGPDPAAQPAARTPQERASDAKARKQQAKRRETAALKEATAGILREQAEADVRAQGEPGTQGNEDATYGTMVVMACAGLIILIAGTASRGLPRGVGILGYALFSIGAGWLILRSAVKSAIIGARRVTHPGE